MKPSGWGRYPVLDCRLEYLRRIRSSPRPVRHPDTLIARVNGRSYGDVALDPDPTLSMLKMDRFRSIRRRYCSTALRSEYSTHGIIVTGLRSRVPVTSISIGFSSLSTVCWRGAGSTGGADSCNTNACCRGTKVRPASGRRLIESPRPGKVRFSLCSNCSARSEKRCCRFRRKAGRWHSIFRCAPTHLRFSPRSTRSPPVWRACRSHQGRLRYARTDA